MSAIVLLDAGPLGMITNPKSSSPPRLAWDEMHYTYQ
jgi:hypothetical protein